MRGRNGRCNGRAPYAPRPRDPAVVGGRDHHRADPGRGRLQPRAGFVPARVRALCDENGILLAATRSSRAWLEPAECGPSSTPALCPTSSVSPRPSPTACRSGDRDPPRVPERWGVGAHGTTFGGNPVSCAAGVAVMRTIEDQGLVANAASRGTELEAGLRALMAEDDRIGDVRGRGLMIGVELVKERATRDPDAAPARRSSKHAPSRACSSSAAARTTT